MSLLEDLEKQRHIALKDFYGDMWGVLMNPQTYHELTAECHKHAVCYDHRVTHDAEYIFGLRLIPSWEVEPNKFIIVDKQFGENILGKNRRERCTIL